MERTPVSLGKLVKTLHITNAWHASSGGIATFYRALMDAANQRKHDMRLVVPSSEDSVEECGSYGRIYCVRARPAPLNPEYRMMRPNVYLRRGTQLRQILNQERPDLIEVCDKYTLNYFAGMLRSGMMGDVVVRPLVVGISCERMDDNVRAYLGWNRLSQSLVEFYMKWLYFALFDHHIANSDYTAEELRRASIGHPIRRGVWVRPMGVDAHDLSPKHRTSFSRYDLLQRAQSGPQSALLLYVGRLAPEKNIRLLLSTLDALRREDSPAWHLLVVGDGVQRQEFLSEGERRAPGRVTWLGHIRDRKELARVYASCDVFIHPNPREPFGIAPLEAMACGLPVVVPDRGGVRAYADSTNAWIAPPDGESFASAVRDAVSNRHVRETKVAKALATAAEFSWDRIANSFLDLYEDLWGNSQGYPGRLMADFYSTPPRGNKSPVARLTAGLVQRLLATR